MSEPSTSDASDAGLSYEEVELSQSAGLRPMIVTAAIVFISGILLTGLPFYWQTGNGELTLFSYTSVLWGVIVVIMGFVYEYWVTSLEEDAAEESP